MKPSDFLQLVILGAIWGASFLFTRIAVPALGPTWLVGIRIGSGALFLLGTAIVLRRSLAGSGRTVDNLRHYAILGFFNTGFPFLLFAYAATTLTASLLSILNSTAPIWGAVIGAALTRTLPVPRVLIGLAAGTTGVALLVLKDASAVNAASVLPVLAGVAAPFCYGLASHYARLRTGHLEPMTVAHPGLCGHRSADHADDRRGCRRAGARSLLYRARLSDVFPAGEERRRDLGADGHLPDSSLRDPVGRTLPWRTLRRDHRDRRRHRPRRYGAGHGLQSAGHAPARACAQLRLAAEAIREANPFVLQLPRQGVAPLPATNGRGALR
jgi:hypothetical protein